VDAFACQDAHWLVSFDSLSGLRGYARHLLWLRELSLKNERSMNSEHVVQLQGVVKRFASRAVIDELDLSVPRGSIFGLIGPNGSGKTTTMRLILRIFDPDEGRVVVLGGAHGSAADPRVGYLPEERGLYRRMTWR
jgi:ABC-type polysaccharide/polyol phosphate transport system ATPase subunit